MTYNLPLLLLFDIDDVLFKTQMFIDSHLSKYQAYPEVFQTLTAIKNKAELGILSQGDKEFQMRKLQETNLLYAFNPKHIHIIPLKDELSVREILNKYKNREVYYVDDRLVHLHLAKQVTPRITTIWLKRGRYLGQELINGFTPDETVTSLDDMPGLLPIGSV